MPKLSPQALKARIAVLQKQLAEAEENKAPSIRKVKDLMKKLGVTLEDLKGAAALNQGLRPRGRPRKKGSEKTLKLAERKVAIKYRDENGNTWTGRGKTPRWLAEAERGGKSREAFKV
jgi:DNA-binding protein H-NS